MPQDKNAVDSFLGEIKKENSPFADQDIFTEDSNVEDEVEKEEVEEKLPFHKDPKVQRYVEKQIAKALKDLPQPSAAQQFREDIKGDKDINLPESFVELVGNDTPQKQRVLKDLEQYFGSLKGEAKQEFLREMEQQQEAQKQEDVQAQEELDAGFEDIEEQFNVDLSSNSPTARKTRSEFVDFVRSVAPKNKEGEVTAFPDLVSTFEVFQDRATKAPTNTRAKQLASRGISRSSDASVEKKGGGSWKDVEKLFSRLN